MRKTYTLFQYIPTFCERETLPDGTPNPNFEKKRQGSQPACQKGVETSSDSSFLELYTDFQPHVMHQFSMIIENLEERANHAAVRKQIPYRRQVFVCIRRIEYEMDNMDDMDETNSFKDWKERIAQEYNVKVRTIERDLEDLKAYFQQADVVQA